MLVGRPYPLAVALQTRRRTHETKGVALQNKRQIRAEEDQNWNTTKTNRLNEGRTRARVTERRMMKGKGKESNASNFRVIGARIGEFQREE